MKRISQKTIDEINATARIEEVVGEYITLKKQGSGYVCRCPFHDDRSPSMHVTPRLGLYNCFVCGNKGGPVRFLMNYESYSYPEALKHLAEKYNIEIEWLGTDNPEDFKKRTENEQMYEVNKFAEKFFMDQLRNTEEGKLVGMSYFLEARGFKMSTIDDFKLGYCPEAWDTFANAAQAAGFSKEILLKVGLCKENKNGGLYDFFRGRVIFPIHDITKKVIGFGARVLQKDSKTAKYLNSSESEIYHKQDTLYDICLAKSEIRKKKYAILVEGYTDVISLFEAGVYNVVASSGTSLTDKQVLTLKRQTDSVTVVYDGDAAGIKASFRGVKMLLEKGFNVRCCQLPEGEDPDSFAKNHRDTEVIDFFEQNAVDFVTFQARILSQEAGTDPIKRSTAIEEVLNAIATVSDQILQGEYVKICARLFGRDERELSNVLRNKVLKMIKDGKVEPRGENVKLPPPPVAPPEESEDKPIDFLLEAERGLVNLLLRYGMYEIRVQDADNDESWHLTRVDQYVFNELFKDRIVLQDALMGKIYDLYGQNAKGFNDHDVIIKRMANVDDQAVSDYVIKSVSVNEFEYSKYWETRYDSMTQSINNSLQRLELQVYNVLLTLKLRLVEHELDFLQNEMKQSDYTEDQKVEMMATYSELVKSRRELSSRLNMVVSR